MMSIVDDERMDRRSLIRSIVGYATAGFSLSVAASCADAVDVGDPAGQAVSLSTASEDFVETIRALIRANYEGAGLRGPSRRAIGQFHIDGGENGWDSFSVASAYQVLAPGSRGDAASIDVAYALVGRVSGETFARKSDPITHSYVMARDAMPKMIFYQHEPVVSLPAALAHIQALLQEQPRRGSSVVRSTLRDGQLAARRRRLLVVLQELNALTSS